MENVIDKQKRLLKYDLSNRIFMLLRLLTEIHFFRELSMILVQLLYRIIENAAFLNSGLKTWVQLHYMV